MLKMSIDVFVYVSQYTSCVENTLVCPLTTARSNSSLNYVESSTEAERLHDLILLYICTEGRIPLD